MEKEGIALLAHLLTGMKDSANKMEEALKDKDMEALSLARKEILNFQQQINNLI